MTVPTPTLSWRSPVLWLVLGLPVATVVAGLWTLRIAAGDSATDSAPEPVKRTAQVQVSDLGADEAAARLGLHAQLRHLPSGDIEIELAGVAATPLQLELIHPIESDRDRSIPLRPQHNGRWRGVFGAKDGIAWHLRLSPLQSDWRLVGRMTPGHTEIALRPALARP